MSTIQIHTVSEGCGSLSFDSTYPSPLHSFLSREAFGAAIFKFNNAISLPPSSRVIRVLLPLCVFGCMLGLIIYVATSLPGNPNFAIILGLMGGFAVCGFASVYHHRYCINQSLERLRVAIQQENDAMARVVPPHLLCSWRAQHIVSVEYRRNRRTVFHNVTLLLDTPVAPNAPIVIIQQQPIQMQTQAVMQAAMQQPILQYQQAPPAYESSSFTQV